MTRGFRRLVLVLVWMVLALPRQAAAHVGSPDVFLDGQAGPYRLFVTVRPPYAIPGVADVEVLTTSPDVREIRIVPLPLTGPGARFAPVPDIATRSPEDPRLFTGHLWMMTAGAWQVRVTATGDSGRGEISVPVPTLPRATLAMTRALRSMLIVLMVLLGTGFIVIVSTTAREARLEPGETPGPAARRRGRVAGVMATGVVVAAVWLGNWWWTVEASAYDRYVYKPLEAAASTAADGRLTLILRDPGWIRTRRLDDFVRDHGHLMHLFVVTPGLDRFWHLHPDEVATGSFEQRLPDLLSGRYEVFADVVHATGVSETATASFETPWIHGAPPGGDDSEWPASGQPDRSGEATAALQDGYRMVWARDNEPLKTKRLTAFVFRIEDREGRPATDLELYMGMPGHAVFIRRDRRVFAHVHPSGSAPMAAIEIGQRSLSGLDATASPGSPGPAAPPVSHLHGQASLPASVSFPYGFPEAGDYRIFVQMKRRGRVETGVFDAHVE